jgi:hypothetical protein
MKCLARFGGDGAARGRSRAPRRVPAAFPARHVIQPPQDQHLRAGEKGGVQLEARILRGRANQRDRAVLDDRGGSHPAGLRLKRWISSTKRSVLAGPASRMVARGGEDLLEVGNAGEDGRDRRRSAFPPRRRAGGRWWSCRCQAGPQKMIELKAVPAATIRPIAPSGPVRCSCPTTSSRRLRAGADRRAGRSRAAARRRKWRGGRRRTDRAWADPTAIRRLLHRHR